MAGISSNALKGTQYSKNRKEFNRIEHTTDLDLNQYDAVYRTLDPQIGRWWQIDHEQDFGSLTPENIQSISKNRVKGKYGRVKPAGPVTSECQ